MTGVAWIRFKRVIQSVYIYSERAHYDVRLYSQTEVMEQYAEKKYIRLALCKVLFHRNKISTFDKCDGKNSDGGRRFTSGTYF